MTTEAGPDELPPPLHRSVQGDGPNLMLLHGVTRCGADWEPLIPALTVDWTVIAVDQRGHGESPRGASYRVTDYVADAVRLVREQFTAPVVLFGHSLGAMVAAAVAAEVPHLVKGIILEDPPFHTMGNRIGGTAWQAQFRGMQEIARHGGSSEEMASALAAIPIPVSGGRFRPLGEIRDQASLSWSGECLSRLDPEVLTPLIEGRWLDGYDLPTILSGIRCPTLLLQGDPTAGGALTDADAEVILTKIPTCQHVRFPGCGHQLHRDRPEEVRQAVEAFAASLPLRDNPPA